MLAAAVATAPPPALLVRLGIGAPRERLSRVL
jgi:hypothetical protein